MYFEKLLKNVQEENKKLREGCLRCTGNGQYSSYYVDGEYISKEQIELVQQVAQREYNEKVILTLEEYIRKLHKVEKLYLERKLEACYRNCCQTRKQLITPIVECIEERIQKFEAEKFEPGNFDENDNTEYYSDKNERMRSKSELLIAKALYQHHIPYHYEKPLELYDWNKPVTFRPDFTVMNPRTGKIYIYEHLGKMDDAEYVARNMKKLDIYEKNGYLMGVNLILTHETGKLPLNTNVLESYISQYFI